MSDPTKNIEYYAKMVDSVRSVTITLKQKDNGIWTMTRTISTHDNYQIFQDFPNLSTASYALGREVEECVSKGMSVENDPIEIVGEMMRLVELPTRKTSMEIDVNTEVLLELMSPINN